MPSALHSDIETRHLQGYSELTLAAPIKPGLVPSLDTRTYATRLKMVLDTLHLLRTTSREYALVRPYSDATDRIRTINSLRMWVDEVHQRLVLSVGFDRPWEAYLRIVWREVGPLLDLVFCNCEGYPISTQCGFETYGQWIARARCDTRFFYNAGNLTFDDQQYLVQLERLVRRTPPSQALTLDLAAAQLGVATPAQASALLVRRSPPWRVVTPAQPEGADVPSGALEATTLGLQALSVLYRLADAYQPGTPDGALLERAAVMLLAEMQLAPVDGALGALEARRRFGDQLAWFAQARHRIAPADDAADSAGAGGAPASSAPAIVPEGVVQPGIVAPYPVEHTHGCVLLISVTQARAAAPFLARLRERVLASPRSAEDRGAVTTVVAFGHEGLQRLGLDEAELEAFPVEFREGMARRAGLLGDVRGNHPDRWQLPLVNWPEGLQLGRCDGAPTRLHLSAAHIVVQLFVASAPAPRDHELAGNPAHPLHAAVTALMDGAEGVVLWSVQALRREFGAPATDRDAKGAPTAAPVARGHFGFLDGLSQPAFAERPGTEGPWHNQVPLGEVLLGHPNAQGETPAPPALLRDGSFLVIRKLEQDVPALEASLGAAAGQYLANTHGDPARPGAVAAAKDLIASKMMGRRRADGAPLMPGVPAGSNDFTYAADPDGSHCPLASHVRRANPRTWPNRGVPRLVRRGMSYGPSFATEPKAERGLLFMAYIARLGEQFETVQRWISGGNGSDGHHSADEAKAIGVGTSNGLMMAAGPIASAYSGDADPLLGVPQAGEPRVFRFVEAAQVHRVPLDVPVPDDPSGQPRAFVTLRWGAYFFCPSLAGLEAIGRRAEACDRALGDAPVVPAGALVAEGERLLDEALAAQARLPDAAAIDTWKALFEDASARRSRRAQAAWAALRGPRGGVMRTAYGVLVGRSEQVQQVLRNEQGLYTVAGYRERQALSIGEIYLGLDAGADHARQATLPNRLISACSEADGSELGYRLAHRALQALVQGQRAAVERLRVPVAGGWLRPPHFELTFDVRELVDRFLADWSQEWFGLPDGVHVEAGRWNWQLQPVRCPAHFTAPSRYQFQPRPGPEAVAHGQAQGRVALAAVRAFVDHHRRTGTLPAGALTRPLFEAAEPTEEGNDQLARTVHGLMIGMLPTVDGCLRSVLNEWMERRELWALQAAWLACPIADRREQCRAVLREPLLRTLMLRPVPEIIWRRATAAHTLGGVAVEAGETIVLGLVSATQDDLGNGLLDASAAFGGDHHAANAPLHACPAQRVALGAMTGFFAALMEAGTLYPTPAPLTLRLRGAMLPPGAGAPAASASAAAPASASMSEAQPLQPSPSSSPSPPATAA